MATRTALHESVHSPLAGRVCVDEERIRSVMDTVRAPEVFDRLLNEANEMLKVGPTDDHDPEYEAEMARSGIDEIVPLEACMALALSKPRVLKNRTRKYPSPEHNEARR